MYTQEQVHAMITDIIGNLSDQGKVSDLLNDFRTDYGTTLADYDKLTTDKTSLEKNNESLRNVNNKMMLQMGDVSTIIKKDESQKEETEKEQEQLEKDKDFNELFDEKGELI